MKTESEIITEFYQIIKGSTLHKKAGGLIIKSPKKRPLNSPTNDIVISVLSGNNGDIQEADLNINVFVHDENADRQSVPSPKVPELERASLDLLERVVRKDYNAKLVVQHTYKVEGVNQHCINNRIYYRTNN